MIAELTLSAAMTVASPRVAATPATATVVVVLDGIIGVVNASDATHVLVPRTRNLEETMPSPFLGASRGLLEEHFPVLEIALARFAKGSTLPGVVLRRIGVDEFGLQEEATEISLGDCLQVNESGPPTYQGDLEIPPLRTPTSALGVAKVKSDALAADIQTAKTFLAGRLSLKCKELIVKTQAMDKTVPVFVAPAEVAFDSNGGLSLRQVGESTGLPAIAIRRTVTLSSGAFELKLNGATLALWPDASNEIKIVLKNVPARELVGLRHSHAELDDAFAHFRALYALADGLKEGARPFFTLIRTSAVAGEPYCNGVGRLEKP